MGTILFLGLDEVGGNFVELLLLLVRREGEVEDGFSCSTTLDCVADTDDEGGLIGVMPAAL
jgi:hypothetical protein